MREWYEWFHTRACPLWSDDANPQCPIMRVQRDNVTPPGLRFYPEALWGRPENPVWFMAINPGQAKRDSSPCDLVAERRACANTVDDPELTLDAYIARHSFVNTFGQDEHHPVFGDKVTSAAFGLLLGEQGMVCVGDPSIDHERRANAVSRLTILNMAHCKCPDYARKIGYGLAWQGRFWGSCGQQNLGAFRQCKPRLIVMFGKPPWLWLRYGAGVGWMLECGCDKWTPYTRGRLSYKEEAEHLVWSCEVLFLPHPSWVYSPTAALQAYNDVCRDVFGQ